MNERLKSLFKIEWEAQKLLHEIKTTGPQIKSITTINPPHSRRSKESINYLIIQGSFDPPTIAHIALLKRAIKLLEKNNPNSTYHIFFLLLQLSYG